MKYGYFVKRRLNERISDNFSPIICVGGKMRCEAVSCDGGWPRLRVI